MCARRVLTPVRGKERVPPNYFCVAILRVKKYPVAWFYIMVAAPHAGVDVAFIARFCIIQAVACGRLRFFGSSDELVSQVLGVNPPPVGFALDL